MRHKVIDQRHARSFGINLRQLRAVSPVAASGSVAKAADSLFRVSSAVARAIAELEETLGAVLFERHSRGMVLTSYGECVLVRAHRIEREFDEARVQLVAR